MPEAQHSSSLNKPSHGFIDVNRPMADNRKKEPPQKVKQRQRQRKQEDMLECLYEVGCILNTGLDREVIHILFNLCKLGISPQALAEVVQELRGEAARLEKEIDEEHRQAAAQDRGQSRKRGPSKSTSNNNAFPNLDDGPDLHPFKTTFN